MPYVCKMIQVHTFHSDRHYQDRIKLIQSGAGVKKQKSLYYSMIKSSVCLCVHMKSLPVWGSTKRYSEKEKREMPSEPEAWETRRHIILEEMHWQQRGTRCNTLMNKYAEGWNWSLVLSGGGKKNKQGWLEDLQFDEWYRSMERSLRDAFYCYCWHVASFCLYCLITAISCSI